MQRGRRRRLENQPQGQGVPAIPLMGEVKTDFTPHQKHHQYEPQPQQEKKWYQKKGKKK